MTLTRAEAESLIAEAAMANTISRLTTEKLELLNALKCCLSLAESLISHTPQSIRQDYEHELPYFRRVIKAHSKRE